MTTFYDILPEAERGLLPALAPLKDIGFVLYGGTAVALRTGHRASLDFDFRTDRPLDRTAIISAVPPLVDARIMHEAPDAWTVQLPSRETLIPAVGISFATAIGRVGIPSLDDRRCVLLASLDDLLAHKLAALSREGVPGDRRDIAALLETSLTLTRGLGAARTLFPDLALSEAAKALVYFEAAGEEVSAADRAILTGEIVRLTGVADLPLLSRHLDLVETDFARTGPM